MRFFLDVLRGRFDDAKMCHRIAAARELEKRGSVEAGNFLKAVGRSENGRAPRRAPVEPGPKDELADFIKEETDDGKEIARFLLDVMRNRENDARMGHKISAAKELLRRAFDIVPQRTGAGDDPHQGAKECRIDKCDHATYTRYRWMVDGTDREALKNIYGSKEAVSFVRRAVVDHRKKNVFDHTYVPDHDFTPIDNPEDDPYGKGSYGYEVLCGQFGDNQAIRVANKAAEEFNKQMAEDLNDEQHSNEDPPENRPHRSGSQQESPVGDGFKPSPGPEQPPAPEPPSRKKRLKIHLGPPSEYPELPQDRPIQAYAKPARGPSRPATEPQSGSGEGCPTTASPTSSSTDPPDNDPPTPAPPRRSGRRKKRRLRRRLLAASRSGPDPGTGQSLVATESGRGPPTAPFR